MSTRSRNQPTNQALVSNLYLRKFLVNALVINIINITFNFRGTERYTFCSNSYIYHFKHSHPKIHLPRSIALTNRQWFKMSCSVLVFRYYYSMTFSISSSRKCVLQKRWRATFDVIALHTSCANHRPSNQKSSTSYFQLQIQFISSTCVDRPPQHTHPLPVYTLVSTLNVLLTIEMNRCHSNIKTITCAPEWNAIYICILHLEFLPQKTFPCSKCIQVAFVFYEWTWCSWQKLEIILSFRIWNDAEGKRFQFLLEMFERFNKCDKGRWVFDFWSINIYNRSKGSSKSPKNLFMWYHIYSYWNINHFSNIESPQIDSNFQMDEIYSSPNNSQTKTKHIFFLNTHLFER